MNDFIVMSVIEKFFFLLVSVSLYGFVKSGFFVGISVVIMYLFDMEL